VDRMGLEKILIILGVDKDGMIPKVDEYWNIVWPSDTYIELQYETARKFLKQKWENSIAIRIVTNFQEFDNAINEKSRKTTYFIWHGSENSITINSSPVKPNNSQINSSTLNSDTQTIEQKKKLSETELYILSCNTGNTWFLGLFDPIAQDIQDHYWFKSTNAPNNYIWSDGKITDIDFVLTDDWKIDQIQGNNGWDFNNFK
jgi:hypothetical protein